DLLRQCRAIFRRGRAQGRNDVRGRGAMDFTRRMYRRITGLTGAVVLVASAAVGAQIVGSHAARAATTPALIGAHLADSDSTRAGQTAWKESLSQFELTTGRLFDVV